MTGSEVSMHAAKRNPIIGTSFRNPRGVLGVIVEKRMHNQVTAEFECSHPGCPERYLRAQQDWFQCHQCVTHGRHSGTGQPRLAPGRHPQREPTMRSFPTGAPLPCLPDVVIHADWGSNVRKRWSVRAERGGDDRYTLARPVTFCAKDDLAASIAEGERGSSVLLGFDFALGVPASFPRNTQGGFLEMISAAENAFFESCDLEVLGPTRPFFRPGWDQIRAPAGQKECEILKRIGLSKETMLRRCERRTDYRRDAACVFLPTPKQQVAGATRAGWREIVRPALASGQTETRLVNVWPFDGPLDTVVAKGKVAIVETYPAELYAHLGISGNSKTVLAWRLTQAPILLKRAEEAGVRVAPELEKDVRDGFGDDGTAEDKFDALVGALAMVRTALGLHRCTAPDDEVVRVVEGWIFCRPIDASPSG